MGWRDRGVEVKTPDQVRAMRVAGLLTGRTLEVLRAAVRPGVTTLELDTLAETHIRDHGGVPSFLGYSDPPFPASICASVNDEVVHGVPGGRTLVESDLISIDCGAIVDDESGQGWHGDSAITVPVGEVAPHLLDLVRAAEESMWAGIKAMRPGGQVRDVSSAVEGAVRAAGTYGILQDFTGHGIGTEMHQPPDVPNEGRANKTALRVGMALAVEPMLTLGDDDWTLDDDEWTVRTVDGSWAAHVEHTTAITDGGLWVLTAIDGGRERLGAAYAPLD